MPEAPVMTGKQVVRALDKMGFDVIGGRGSHTVMRDSITGNTTTVPQHDTDLPRGTMGNIMRTAGVTAEELRNPRKAKHDRQAAVETKAAMDKTGGTAPANDAVQGRGDQQQGKAGRGRGGKANRERGRDR